MWAVAGDEEFHGTAWLHKQTAMLVISCVAPPCIYIYIYCSSDLCTISESAAFLITYLEHRISAKSNQFFYSIEPLCFYSALQLILLRDGFVAVF